MYSNSSIECIPISIVTEARGTTAQHSSIKRHDTFYHFAIEYVKHFKYHCKFKTIIATLNRKIVPRFIGNLLIPPKHIVLKNSIFISTLQLATVHTEVLIIA